MKSSKDFKIDEVVNYAFNFYSQNGRSLESQDICIAKIMQMTGLDYATSIDIQSPILSILMYNEMVGISNQITSSNSKYDPETRNQALVKISFS